MEKKHKHLEFIQSTITRMAANCFLIKGWTVTLISALFALSAGNSNLDYVIISFLPLPVFWVLDGYYLWQERLYRALYDQIRIKKEEEIDFTMSTKQFIKKEKGWIKAIFSKTLVMFYGLVLMIMFIVIEFIKSGVQNG